MEFKMTPRNIYIIGPGAIGLYLGYKLSNHNRIVFLFCNKKIYSDSFMVTIQENEVFENFNYTIFDDFLKFEKDDLILISTKIYSLASIFRWLEKEISLKTPKILLVQNGIFENSDFTTYDNLERIIIDFGIEKISGSSIKKNGSGYLYTSKEWIGKLFEEAGIKSVLIENVLKFAWKKSIVNSIINPITALNDINNGKLLNPIYKRKADILLYEDLALSKKIGNELSSEEMSDYLYSVVKNTFNNRSSMLQDFQNQRRTEIDFLNGKLLRIAASVNMELPENRSIYENVKLIDREIMKGRIR